MMVGKGHAARDSQDKSTRTNNSRLQRSVKIDETQAKEIVQHAEEDARQIVAQAYKEADGIITKAKRKARNISADAGESEIAANVRLSRYVKSGRLTKDSYEDIDTLFVQIRYHLTKLERYEHKRAEELRDLVNRLEYWVESLVVDSLKLESLTRWLQRTMEMARKLRKKLDSE